MEVKKACASILEKHYFCKEDGSEIKDIQLDLYKYLQKNLGIARVCCTYDRIHRKEQEKSGEYIIYFSIYDTKENYDANISSDGEAHELIFYKYDDNVISIASVDGYTYNDAIEDAFKECGLENSSWASDFRRTRKR